MRVLSHDAGRARQRARTRRQILDAAIASIRAGTVPSVEEAAAAAEVSPATGYRYFPSQSALIQQAMDAVFPSEQQVSLQGEDAAARIDTLIDVGFPNLVEHETFDRAVLRLALDQWLRQRSGRDLKEPPVQRMGRKRLVSEVMEPLRPRLSARRRRRLELAFGMILGIESFIALADIYDATPSQIGEVWRWACKALVAQALSEERQGA